MNRAHRRQPAAPPALPAVIAALLALLATEAAANGALSGFDCLVEPYAVVDVSTREEGTIETMLVERGDVVEAGQPVAQLDASVEQATVELAEARTQMDAEIDERKTNVAFTRRELARVDELLARNAISTRDKDQFQTEAARARLQLKQTEQRQRVALLELELARRVLARRTITAPIAGVVVERLMSAGESVENQALLRLAQVNPLRVELIVPIDHFGAISRDDRASVLPRYPGATEREARVTIVDRVVDAASNTFGVRLELPNPGNEVPGGVRCEVIFNR